MRRGETVSQRQRPIIIIILLFSIIAVVLAALTMIHYFSDNDSSESGKNSELKYSADLFEHVPKQALVNSTQRSIYLPAVDSSGEGTMTLLTVEGVSGTGRTLMDIDGLLFWADTQHSIRIAKKVAASLTSVDTDKFDLVYTIYANASTVGGESAGAAITIATMAVIQNKDIRKDVVITGTINHDGTIGPVDGIFEKAEAAKAANATVFLVPLLGSMDIAYTESEHCEKFGPADVCTKERIPSQVNVSQEVGITVIEVSSIEEAARYFFE